MAGSTRHEKEQLMLLQSITIKHFQHYEQSFTLTGLSAGINVVYGSNEAGKSTLLRALRAVLFDRFNGKAAEEYAGYQGASPEVRIEFELKGMNYSLEKIFSKKKEGRALLRDGRGMQWLGNEAEQHVANLLRCDLVERGMTKSEQQGVCGVLWIDQGSAWHQLSIVNNSKATQAIQSVLNHELTDMLSQGKGEGLLKKFSDALSDYQTEKNAKPKGVYKEQLEKKEAAKKKLKLLQEELNNYQSKVDELSRLQQDLAVLIADKVEENDQQMVHNALTQLKHVEDIKNQQRENKRDLELGELKQKNAASALNERLSLITTLATETKQQQSAQVQQQQLEQEIELIEKDLKNANDLLAKATINYEISQLNLKKARDYQKLTVIQSECMRMAEQLQKVHTLNKDIKEKKVAIAHIALDSSIVAQLRKSNEQIHCLQAQFDAVATRIEYLIKDESVTLNGVPMIGQGDVLICDKALIKFGANSISITPGGEELGVIQTKLADAKKQFTRQLAHYCVASLPEAEEQCDIKNNLIKEVRLIQAQVELIAPEPIDSLEHQWALKQIEEKQLITQLADSAVISTATAEEIEHSAGKELARCNEYERQLHDKCVKKQEAVKHATMALLVSKNTLDLLNKKLAKARDEHSDQQLEDAHNQQTKEQQQIKEHAEQLEHRLQSLDYDGAVAEVERRQQVLLATQKRLADLKQSVRDLSIELQTSGHRGLAEEKQQAEQELQEVSREVERLQLHAGSLNLLCQLIKEDIQTAKELLVKPLTEAITPYLKILFPGCEPIIDDEFCLHSIVRDGIREPFENLSIGTREQLSILLRIAYADLLANKGSSVPIILDDALVNSDDERREKMKQILHRASKKYQIIVLTCHGADYRDSGGVFHSL